MAIVANTGSLPRDGFLRTIPVAHTYMFEDNTGTPQVSPLTVADTPLEIPVPVNAISLIIRASAADLRVGKTDQLDATSGDGYELLPSGLSEEYDCADAASYWVKRDASTSVTMSFKFKILKSDT